MSCEYFAGPLLPGERRQGLMRIDDGSALRFEESEPYTDPDGTIVIDRVIWAPRYPEFIECNIEFVESSARKAFSE